MADVSYEDDQDYSVPGRAAAVQKVVNISGALVSLVLIGGLAVWGYRLMVRDVTGVPVVRALEGPMRIAPDDPGGELAAHQGLAVNRVAAEGEAAPPPERLVLAPRAGELADEDRPSAELRRTMQSGKVANAVNAALAQAAASDPLPEDEGEMPASKPVHAPAAVTLAAATAAPPQVVPPVARAASDDPAPRLSADLRAPPRPRSIGAANAATPAATPAKAAAVPEEIAPAAVPAGSRLVQLGAFDDAETARKEWTRLQKKFGTYMTGKSRVIQTAESGGRTFYRLRAHGFKDEADARRFCSALLAEQAACIPVTVR